MGGYFYDMRVCFGEYCQTACEEITATDETVKHLTRRVERVGCTLVVNDVATI
jgi:hypothetical protein